MRHELKTLSQYFSAVKSGAKTFEIRFNDRWFSVGDELLLVETRGLTGPQSGRKLVADITYITDFEQKPGYVVMGIKVRDEASE